MAIQAFSKQMGTDKREAAQLVDLCYVLNDP
jgi:hypothetical protein